MLAYAKKLTETPGAVDDADFAALREAGWQERGIYQATALISFFNFSGRLEAASGLPMDGAHLGDALVRMLPRTRPPSAPAPCAGPGLRA